VQPGRHTIHTPPSLGQRPRWFAVQCLSRREAGAAAHLGNQGYETFLPCCRKIRRHARRIDTVLAPFFPGYLFVAMDLSRDRWRSVNGTYGVARLVMQGDAPAPLPVDFVATLRRACDERGVMSPGRDLKPGQSVRFLAGPFADSVGELERLDGPDRVRVLLDILGRGTSVTVSRDIVIHAEFCL
jgi:transcription elongation factor/antiterminator RfaH